MGLFDLLLIAAGLSMDAFAVSVTNGMTILKLKRVHYFAIAFAFGFFQAVMPVAGYFLGSGFEKYINNFDHWIALILLSIIGGKMIFEGLKCREEKTCRTICFTFKMLLAQAVATSIDALMVGVTFSAMGVPLLSSVIIIGAVTFFVSLAGVGAGRKFGGIMKSKSEMLGGIILTAIGLKIFIEHLLSGS